MKHYIKYKINSSFYTKKNIILLHRSFQEFKKHDIYFIEDNENPYCILFLKSMEELQHHPDIGNDAFLEFSWTLYSKPIEVYFLLENWLRIPVHKGSEYTNLNEYRIALINHELAHVLGFGHVHCPRPGLPCDVRQQPSVSLGGCIPTTQIYLYENAEEKD